MWKGIWYHSKLLVLLTMLHVLCIFNFAFASEERTTLENLYDGDLADQVMFTLPIDNRTDSELTLLELLDREMCTILMDPYGSIRPVSDKDGDILMRNLMLFESYVKKAIKMRVDKTVKQDEALMKSVEVMFKKGWPQFMILTVEDNGKHLMRGLKWNVSDMYEFYHYRSEANSEWDELRSIIECE